MLSRRGGRAVDCAGLENRRAGNGPAGSNPAPSASFAASSPTPHSRAPRPIPRSDPHEAPRLFARRVRAPIVRPSSLEVDGLLFELRWSARRRTVEIAVDARGRLRLAAPAGCTLAFLEQFARRKRRWVLAKLAEREASGPPPEPPRFVTGEELPYLGRSFPLIVVERSRPGVALLEDRFRMSERAAADGRRHFAAWAKRAAAEWIAPRVELLVPPLGRAPSSVKVREMGRRWGSCSRDGRVGFNWRLILLAPELVDYVVVHELAHLVEHNHGPGFWRVVEAAQPDFRERREALQRAAVAIGWTWD